MKESLSLLKLHVLENISTIVYNKGSPPLLILSFNSELCLRDTISEYLWVIFCNINDIHLMCEMACKPDPWFFFHHQWCRRGIWPANPTQIQLLVGVSGVNELDLGFNILLNW